MVDKPCDKCIVGMNCSNSNCPDYFLYLELKGIEEQERGAAAHKKRWDDYFAGKRDHPF